MTQPAGEFTIDVEEVEKFQLIVRFEKVAPGADAAAFSKCLSTFEDFWVVTQSVRRGVPVPVSVNGQALPEAS